MKALLLKAKRFTPDREGGMKEYYLGQIPARGGESHKIALALSGQGNNQAAARATNLLHDFPSVKHILMVGIAGGVPNPAEPASHVRLGDIVVSGDHGIKQYDFIKRTRAHIEHRDPPRPPSSSLLEAVKFLESELLAGKQPYLVHIATCLKLLSVRKPAARYDVLVATEDESQIIKHPRDPSRVSGRPRVFISPIASANVLLKNAKKRDAIRDKFGVRAVEMEGSGIADASWNLDIGYLGVCRG